MMKPQWEDGICLLLQLVGHSHDPAINKNVEIIFFTWGNLSNHFDKLPIKPSLHPS